MPATEFVPATQSELARWMRENASGPRQTLCPVGGRTALQFGIAETCDTLVDLKDLRKVVDYPARDMTVTVEAGIPISELQRLLATEAQQLPIDIPQATRATLGGAIACNSSGPRRYGYGTLRDYIIGISAVDAGGQLFKGGGRVVKNVAGYDLCKLMVGSRGTLAVISQVTLKLKPIPQATGWWWFTFETFAEMENVLERLLTSETRPVALEMLDVPAARMIAAESRLSLPCETPVLAVLVEGSSHDVSWQLATLRKEVIPFGVQDLLSVEGPEALTLTATLTEFSVPTDEPLTFQANLKPSHCWRFAEMATALDVAVNCHAGNGVIVGQLPESVATAAQAQQLLQPLRDFARSASGNLVVLHCDREWQSQLPLCGDEEPAWPQMRQLRTQMDPHQLLNRGIFL